MLKLLRLYFLLKRPQSENSLGSIYLQMDIKKALLNILGDLNTTNTSKLDHYRRDKIRSRNSQKTPLIQQADPSNKHYYLFKPINQKANAIAMKYVQSHHPSIKDRVVKILSNHRKIPGKANNETIVLNFPKDQTITHMNTSRKHSLNTITYQDQNQKQNKDKSNQASLLQMYINQYQSLKPCKISSITLLQRSEPQYKRSKTISSHARTLSNIQYTPQRKLGKKSRRHSTFKENGFFTGWEPVETQNQSFFS